MFWSKVKSHRWWIELALHLVVVSHMQYIHRLEKLLQQDDRLKSNATFLEYNVRRRHLSWMKRQLWLFMVSICNPFIYLLMHFKKWIVAKRRCFPYNDMYLLYIPHIERKYNDIVVTSWYTVIKISIWDAYFEILHTRYVGTILCNVYK